MAPCRSIAAFLAACSPIAAHAGSASGTMAVSLRVEPTCSVLAEPMVFEGRAGSDLRADAGIAVSCSIDSPVAVSLDGGLNALGGQRRLAGRGGLVPYELYSDPARHSLWTPGDRQSLRVSAGETGTLRAYGAVVPAATLAPEGDYRDSVTVQVDF